MKKYFRTLLFFSLTLLLSFTDKTEKEPSIPIQNGMWNGHYISYYPNGNKKAEGDLKNNLRVGKWIVWDSLGQKQVERFYRNNFDCDITIQPKYSNSSDDKSVLKYILTYNKDGFIDYYPLKNDKIIMCTKRVWRTLDIWKDNTEMNKHIYENDVLWNLLHEHILNGEITLYDPKDDEFTTEMVPEGVSGLRPTVKPDSIIAFAGFRIKEDWFYDSERKISEARIIGICIMEKTKSSPKESKPLGWIFYPEARKYLAKCKPDDHDKDLPSNIKTMDDLFFFRYFSSTIYKQTNLEDLELKNYCKTPEEIKKENIRIENEMLDMEHNVWMDEKFYARPKK